MTSLLVGTGDHGVRGGRGERFSQMFVYLRNSPVVALTTIISKLIKCQFLPAVITAVSTVKPK